MADGVEIIDLLKRHASFASLGNADLARIVAESEVETVAAGAAVFAQDDPGSAAYLVLDGEMAVEVDTPVGRSIVAVIPTGDVVGEIGAFASIPRTATVTALTPARLLRLEQRVIRPIVRDHPEIGMSVISELGKRLQSVNASIATLTQAARALAKGEFEPTMLATLKNQADRFGHFAHVFEDMANEITRKWAYRQEMQTAAEIQRSFLPADLDPGVFAGWFEIFASMAPASDVGGDFYDYFMLDGRRLAFAIGDVSGKGVPAAMFMSVSRTVLRTIAREGWGPGQVLTRMNNLLAEDSGEGMFVTLFYGCVELDEGRMEFASAGHHGVQVLPVNGGARKIGAMGSAVGLLAGAEYPTESCQLGAGDTVFLSTDGITEAFNSDGAMFGEDRLDSLLDSERGQGAQKLVRAVTGVVDAFTRAAPQADDITCLAFVYHGDPEMAGG